MAALTSEQIKLFEALHDSRTEDFKTFNKKSYRGVWGGIIDKYPETAHFIYELLQNADDAGATEAQITLFRDKLYFKHNGTKHFNVTKEDAEEVGDINSITGIGDSTKTDLDNKIGKFGVGFKAVFQYTDTPEIYDDLFKFKIEHYIIPTLLQNDHPCRSKGETLFVFPFSNRKKSLDEKHEEILERLEVLQEPILFLRNLKRISWKTDDDETKETIYSKNLINKTQHKDITLEHYHLHGSSQADQIFLFSRPITITDENGKKANHLIYIGFYYNSADKKLITNSTQPIYCFFPTKESFKTCFVSHAPFLLTDNRQNLKPNERLNSDLITLLAELATEAIVILRDIKSSDNGKCAKLINENITEIIPNYQSAKWNGLDRFEGPMFNAFKNLINKEKILLSRNEHYLTCKEALTGSPKELVELLNQRQISVLRRNWYDEDDYEEDDTFIENTDFLKWELAQEIIRQDNTLYGHIEHYTSENFANDITPQFMEVQDVKWVFKLYTFLRTSAPKLWKVIDKGGIRGNALPFRKAPIIKLQNNKWVAPYIDNSRLNVFFPLTNFNNTSSEYNFIHSDYLSNEAAVKFFKELEIKEPDEYDYISQVILGRFENATTFSLADLKADFYVLLKYYQKVKNDTDKEHNYIELLREKIRLLGKNKKAYQPDTLSIPNKYVKTYFGINNQPTFIDEVFYYVGQDEFELSEIEEFMTRLGVKKGPRVIEQRCRYNPRIRNLTSTLSFYESFLDKDYTLEGFDELCKEHRISKELSYYLWNDLLTNIPIDNYGLLVIKYRQKYARTWETVCYPSTFKIALQNEKWLYDKNGKLVSPSEVYLEDLSLEYNYNEQLTNFLGIEKREKSILELGGTQEQQDFLEYGKLLYKITGKKLTEDELRQLLRNTQDTNLSVKDSVEDVKNETKSSIAKKNEERNSSTIGQTKKIKIESICDKNDTKDFISQIGTSAIVFPVADDIKREELRKADLTEQFSSNVNKRTPKVNQALSDAESADIDNADVIMQQLVEQEEKNNKIKLLRETAETAPRYSKEWFDALIELEYRGRYEDGHSSNLQSTTKSLNISFGSVNKEATGERIYLLSNPSRYVPLWLEEIGDLEVKFYFSNSDDYTVKFEVANVRDNHLRLKASKIYEAVLDKIDWKKCTRASITLKNQIDLMGKLQTAFNSLQLEKGFNLKEHLTNNIKFIFGPPGTGKTTNIARKIIRQMQSNDSCKILVLAPTNTACDEIARKIKQESDGNCIWLSRFISAADEFLDDIVVDRDSKVYESSKCCLISTIARLSFDGFNSVNGFRRLSELSWDMIICDEASMIPLAEIVLAIYNFSPKPIIIAGDPMQIKPILHEDMWKDENIYTMVKLDRFDQPTTEPIQFEIENLPIQYRSVPAIGNLFSQYAYNGKLKHNRHELPTDGEFGQLKIKPINFISFKVEKYDSIFGTKKLDGSNVHIYSALFTVELFKYIVKEYVSTHNEDYSVGIVCPYAAQAQLIESLIEQIPDIPSYINIIVGTVHRFQGGQCNLLFAVFNPPLGLKAAPDRIFLNDKSILNVAISRAQDHLCILLPHCDTEGYENLYEINTIGRIALSGKPDVASFTCDEIEKLIFNRKFFIESQTFVTSHQLTNVYTKAIKRYEVRIDEKSVDVQIGGLTDGITSRSQSQSSDAINEVKKPAEIASENRDISIQETANQGAKLDSSPGSDIRMFSDRKPWMDMLNDDYFLHLKASNGTSISLLTACMKEMTAKSVYISLNLVGNKDFIDAIGYEPISKTDISTATKVSKNSLLLGCWLHYSRDRHHCPFKGYTTTLVKNLSFTDFASVYDRYIQGTNRLQKQSIVKAKAVSSPPKKKKSYSPPKSKGNPILWQHYSPEEDNSKMYDQYDHGLSDW